ncbi:MAG TPA: decaprenyl-phosphate phosphoribosyltransferase [Caldilineae bacterium]|nr:decaprenyl-phosphate phosphoribosyltransferase [Caldilineae bacterium]
MGWTRALFKTMRPRQWTKNVFVFAALIFDGKLMETPLFLRTLAAFLWFCVISSAVYIINDLADIEKDRAHPDKRRRPLASGQLSPRVAVIAAVTLAAIGLVGAFATSVVLGEVVLGYLLLNLAYSFYLKNIVIVDVMSIAAGFVLRVLAGVVVVQVERFSPWLYMCTTLLALFVGLGKRRHEITLLAENANVHRPILDHYTVAFLDQLISLVTGTTVIAYSLYTFSAPNLPPNHLMMLTIPFVLYALFRYLYLIHVRGLGGAPDELLLQDIPFLLSVLLWGATVVVILYIIPRQL